MLQIDAVVAIGYSRLWQMIVLMLMGGRIMLLAMFVPGW